MVYPQTPCPILPRDRNANYFSFMNFKEGRDGANWREVILPAMAEVAPEIKAILEKPIIIEIIQGEIRNAKISGAEPEWSVNMKKALALLFQTKIDSASWLPTEENQVNYPTKIC